MHEASHAHALVLIQSNFKLVAIAISVTHTPGSTACLGILRGNSPAQQCLTAMGSKESILGYMLMALLRAFFAD